MCKWTTLIIVIALCLACNPKGSKGELVGHWTGEQNQHMIFKEDSTLLWIFEEMLLTDTFSIKYQLNLTTIPKQIDLFNFNKGILKDKILTGIFEKIGKDSLLLDFIPADTWAEADSSRPKQFDPEDKKYFVRKPK